MWTWMGWLAFGVLLLVYISFARHMTRRSQSVIEYLEYLLLHPIVYDDHRKKYIELLKTIGGPDKSPVNVAMATARSIAVLAEGLYNHIQIPNVVARARPHDTDVTGGPT